MSLTDMSTIGVPMPDQPQAVGGRQRGRVTAPQAAPEAPALDERDASGADDRRLPTQPRSGPAGSGQQPTCGPLTPGQTRGGNLDILA